jgi:hypothetical protein
MLVGWSARPSVLGRGPIASAPFDHEPPGRKAMSSEKKPADLR